MHASPLPVPNAVAARESPGGRTIAHGLLSLSLIPAIIREIIGLAIVEITAQQVATT